MSIEISVIDVLRALLHRLWLIILCAVIGFASTFVYNVLFIKPVYSTNTLIYISNRETTTSKDSGTITANDITAAQKLVDTYSVFITTNEFLDTVKKSSGVDYSISEIRKMISTESEKGTEVLKITVKGTDATKAVDICNAIMNNAPTQIKDIMGVGVVKAIQSPIRPKSPVSPVIPRNSILGALVGIFLVSFIIILIEIFDTTLKSPEDLANRFEIPILGEIPNFEESSSEV